MSTEERNPRTLDLDLLDTLDLLRLINAEDRTVARAVGRVLPQIAEAVDRIAARLSRGGRLLYVGAGTSGRLGVLDAVECPPTFGVEAELVQGVLAGGYEACYRAVEASEDRAEKGETDLRNRALSSRDAVVGLSASGSTPYTLGAVRYARQVQALTIGISCNRTTPLSTEVEVAIEVEVGSEVLAGSTRMKAGSAEKMVLNMISTATMVRLGHVYSNLMVGVLLKNRKLMNRALRIIGEIAQVPLPRARAALEQSGDAKSAIIMLKLGCGVEQARRLARQHASLREILGEK